MRRKLWVAVVIIILLSACGHDVLTPVAAPVLPARLTNLPRSGQVHCDKGKGTYGLWQFPGIEPGDKDSAYQGYKGDDVGSVHPCEAVTVIQVSWSEWDAEYYVMVETSLYKGWIMEKFIELDHPKTPNS